MRRVALFVLAASCCAIEVRAQSLLERVERDELAVVTENDPIMVAAIRKARASLPEFLRLARAPDPSMSSFAIKVPVRAGDQSEYFWITEFKHQDGHYSGRIDNIPRWATNLKMGDTIEFAESDIVDWLYVQDRRMKGNFTFCALMQREPRTEARALIKRFGADCKR